MSAMEESIDAYRKGAVGYLTKPVSREQLIESFDRIESLIHRSMQKILIIEDNTAMRAGIKQLICDESIQAVEVETGAKALETIEKDHFDCIILDLGLPDMSGFELLEKLEASRRIMQIPPVIIYTGMEITSEQEQELEKYASSIIIKGVKSRERLLDETALFLHKVVADMPEQKRKIITDLYNRDSLFEGKKILLADDDMRNVFAIAKVLEDNRMKVIKAANGQKALEALAKEPDVDLILMDLMMPVMDGLEATKKIREKKELKKIPIIAVTAKAMKEDQEKCFEAGANDYLAKPINIERLLSLMRLWLYH
jgi:CheY-like chemotaxis protein